MALMWRPSAPIAHDRRVYNLYEGFYHRASTAATHSMACNYPSSWESYTEEEEEEEEEEDGGALRRIPLPNFDSPFDKS